MSVIVTVVATAAVPPMFSEDAVPEQFVRVPPEGVPNAPPLFSMAVPSTVISPADALAIVVSEA